jgi:hypothetical protein
MVLNVLVGCEESQAVCKAFRELGHNAFSCDLKECSGGHPEWHLQMSVFDALKLRKWDLFIAHPPCTFLSRAGQAWKTRGKPGTKEYREAEAGKAIEFMRQLWSSDVDFICIENPVGLANTRWKKPSQIVHPYYFGDNEMKETCFWLKRLPRLNGLIHIDAVKNKPKPTKTWIGSDGKTKNEYFCGRMDKKGKSAELKSKTFPGIARAMAEQWSRYVIKIKSAKR